MNKKVSTILNEIKDFHHVHFWQLNYKDLFFESHIDLENNINISEFQEILSKIEKILNINNITHFNIQPEYNKIDSKNLISQHEKIMMEKTYLGLILLFFILAFAIKNIKTYLSVGQSIKGKSLKMTISIVLSTFIYLLIASRLTILKPAWILEINKFKFEILIVFGFLLVSLEIIIRIFALIAMKKSWRVGIRYDQKTKLVTSGIYRMSRNPYFLSYDLLIFGYMLIFPSVILFLLYLPLVFVFHKMILEEEKYLETVHGGSYLNYKKRVNRYL